MKYIFGQIVRSDQASTQIQEPMGKMSSDNAGQGAAGAAWDIIATPKFTLIRL